MKYHIHLSYGGIKKAVKFIQKLRGKEQRNLRIQDTTREGYREYMRKHGRK